MFLHTFYNFVYRESDVSSLNATVKTGIYKGIVTTTERKEFVEDLQAAVCDRFSEDDTICVVSLTPMLYFMTDAGICSPQTWEAQYLYRGNTSAAPLLDYFESMGELPDFLLATDQNIEDFYENPTYEINLFIEKYYTLSYSAAFNDCNLWIWERKAD